MSKRFFCWDDGFFCFLGVFFSHIEIDLFSKTANEILFSKHTSHVINNWMLPLTQNTKKTTMEGSWRTTVWHVFLMT